MPTEPNFPNLEVADDTLQALLAETERLEKTNPFESGRSVSKTAVNSLFQTRVSFGNPRNELIALTKDRFAAMNIELTPIYALQLENEFDFYAMSLNVNLQPQLGAVFKLLGCRLQFRVGAEESPIIQTIFPQNQWQSVINWGGSLKLGLTGSLNWEAGVAMPDTSSLAEIAPDLQAKIKNENEMNSFIVMPSYQYEIGRLDIAAGGEGGADCFWQMQSPDLQKSTSIKLNVVFKVPKGTQSIELSGLAYAEPKLSWLVASLQAIRHSISETLSTILQREDTSKLARGVEEQWTIQLPQY